MALENYDFLWDFFPKNVFSVRISIFWWKFNFKGSKEIIFRVGHVTVGLHMFHNVNFWLDLKIKSKNIRIFQIVDSNSKTDKNIKIRFSKHQKMNLRIFARIFPWKMANLDKKSTWNIWK